MTSILEKNQEIQNEIISACRSNNLFLLKNYFQAKLPINSCDEDLNTCLHYAAKQGSKDIAEWLINNNALFLLNRFGQLPVDIATEYQHFEICQLFNQKPQTILAVTVDSQVQQIQKMHQLNGRISSLQNKITENNYRIQSLPNNTQKQQLQNFIGQDEKLLKSLLEEKRQEKILEEKLNELFALDDESGDSSLRSFYCKAQTRITAHIIGSFSAASGYLETKSPTEQDVGNLLINGLSFIGDSVLQSIPGLGVANILNVLITEGALYYWNQKYEKKMKEKFTQTTDFWGGDLGKINQKTKVISYALTNLFQMQLPHCTPEDMEKIIHNWITSFNSAISGHSKLQCLTSKIKKMIDFLTPCSKKTWDVKELLKKSGISYPNKQQDILYESAYFQKNNKALTQAEKYGYLTFESKEEAKQYKLQTQTDKKKSHRMDKRS